MPIQPVSGEIQARPLNDNFSYLDSKTNNISKGSPAGSYATLAALESAYPNGNGNMYVVSGDGKWYYWNGTSWVAGGTYQATQIADQSIVAQKIAAAGITMAEIANQGAALPVAFKFTDVDPGTGNKSTTRLFSETIKLSVGDKIQLENTTICEYSFYRTDGGTNIAWRTADYPVTQEMSGFFSVRKPDTTTISESERITLARNIFVTTEDTITNLERFTDKVKELSIGAVPLSTFNVTYNDMMLNRVATDNLLYSLSNYSLEMTKVLTWNYTGSFSNSDTMYVVIETDDESGELGSLFYFRQRLGSSVINRVFSEYIGDGKYFIQYPFLTEGVDNANLLLDNRNGSKDILIKSLSATINALWSKRNDSNEQSIAYVDGTSGNDNNDGSSESSAVKTMQKAIDLNAKTIVLKKGSYVGPVVSTSLKDKLTIIGNGSTVLGAEKLTLTSENGLLECNYTATESSRMYQVFIAKSLEPISDPVKFGFNVGLWEMTDKLETTLKLVPVLTKAEMETTKGSFFFDGTTIYINSYASTSSTEKEYWLTFDDATFQIWNVKDLKINDLAVKYSYGATFDIDNNSMFELKNCEASYSANGDGFSVDYANGNFYGCRAFRNSNDGFNFHFEGDTHLFDCVGMYNHDDGNSHHENCTGSIHGGEWAFNRKGGCSPATGSQIDIYDVYSHHNGNGIYNVAGSAEWQTCRFFGNVLIDNVGADLAVNGYTVISHNNHYQTSIFTQGAEKNLIEY
ncbi:hypothetical protein ACR76W_13665 [Enterococcus casseliflavus]|uniref:hypothetical protein n=1 Tax=Enterococcus casseliflavus TaxID=37734 RepID=UPI003DA682A8